MRWYLTGLGVALLVGLLVWLVWFSSVLSVRTVQVEGNAILTQAQVAEAAAVPLGTPLVRVDLDAVTQRVAGLQPVAAVKVTRSWPSTIKISVTERTPVYQLKTDAGNYGWVDSTGVLFFEQTKKRSDLVVVEVGEPSQRLLSDVATVLASLSPELTKRVTGVKAETPDQINLTLSGGATLVWGSADKSALKSQVATVLLEVKAKVYDVSSPETPITK